MSCVCADEVNIVYRAHVVRPVLIKREISEVPNDVLFLQVKAPRSVA